MFRFRDEQMQAFEQLSRPTLVERIIEMIRERGTGRAQSKTDGDIRDEVCSALKNAAAIGLRREESLIQFANIAFHLDPDFHQSPVVASLLRDENRSERERVELLYRRIRGDE